jgi:hypothetical protein
MTKTFVPALVGLLLLTGCSHDYVLTMGNGDRIRTAGKPRLVNGFYYFKDGSGREARPVFSGSVREIAPASMASDNQTSAFKPVQSK